MFHIGALVRQLRKARHQTIVELSKLAGVNKNTWSRFERTGERFEDDTLSRIATALGFTASDLYALENEQRVRVRTEIVDQLSGNKDVAHDVDEVYTNASPATDEEQAPMDQGALDELIRRWRNLPTEAQEAVLDFARRADIAHTSELVKRRPEGLSSAGARQKKGRR